MRELALCNGLLATCHLPLATFHLHLLASHHTVIDTNRNAPAAPGRFVLIGGGGFWGRGGLC